MASMKSSREPVRATTRSSGGTSRVPRRNAAIRTTAEISSDCRDAEAATALAGDDRHERQHRRQAEVLDDAETERHAGMRALHLSPAQERLEGDDRAGDGEGAAKQESRTQGPAPRQPRGRSQDDRERDLDRAAQQRGAADADHFAEGELDTESEHQERDAEIGQQLHPIQVGHQAGRVRTDGQSREDVADQRGQPQALRDETADRGRAQRDHDVDDEANILHRIAPAGLRPTTH